MTTVNALLFWIYLVAFVLAFLLVQTTLLPTILVYHKKYRAALYLARTTVEMSFLNGRSFEIRDILYLHIYAGLTPADQAELNELETHLSDDWRYYSRMVIAAHKGGWDEAQRYLQKWQQVAIPDAKQNLIDYRSAIEQKDLVAFDNVLLNDYFRRRRIQPNTSETKMNYALLVITCAIGLYSLLQILMLTLRK